MSKLQMCALNYTTVNIHEACSTCSYSDVMLSKRAGYVFSSQSNAYMCHIILQCIFFYKDAAPPIKTAAIQHYSHEHLLHLL